MTVSQLYSLYRAAHVEALGVTEAGGLGACEVSVSGSGLTYLERVILEFALHDATNGTALRSPESFGRAVEQGADLLRGLGLRIDPPRGDDGRAGPPVLDEAA
jgi:hypothetical protein